MTEQDQPNFFIRSIQAIWQVLLALLFTTGVVLVLLFPVLPRPQQTDLQENDVAEETILAPRDISYVSAIETEAARDAAEAAVQPIFEDADPRIGRQQVRLTQQILSFVATVRSDSFADAPLRITYVDQIIALTLNADNAAMLVSIPDMQYEQVQSEIIDLVEEAMSGEVREDRVADALDDLPLRVSTDLQDDLVPLVLAVAEELIVPNSFLNEAATQEARQAARDRVEDVVVTYRQGEAIVRSGERVSALDVEALEQFGLTEPEVLTWEPIASAVLVGVLTTTLLGTYIALRDEPIRRQPVRMTFFAVLVLLFLLAAQIVVPNRGDLAYLFPMAALAMSFVTLLGLEYAALVVILVAVLTGYMSDFSLEITGYIATMGLFAAGSLRRGARLNAYFISGMVAALGGIAVVLIFRLPTGIDPTAFGTLAGVALVNGLISAGFALVIILAVGNLTDITTSLELIDLTRPDHPLQRRLQQEAIGTYHHTLAVVNLAEAAAEAIGADTLLTRVGVLYHDVGKMVNPGFFIENRIEGVGDAYEHLSPLASARIIKSHVSEGVRMAKQHRLPPPVIAFIRTHHGTRPIMFFLRKAQDEAAEAGLTLEDDSPYRHDGPKPQTRETGITLMADACESATRANRPSTGEEIEQLVTRLIRSDIENGQLDESGLSLKEIAIIRETFIRTLKGMYHPRIKYPSDAKPAAVEAAEPTGEPEEEDETQPQMDRTDHE